MAVSRSLATQDLQKFTFQFNDFETLVEPLFQRLVQEGRFDKVHSNNHWQTVGRRKGDKTNVRYTPLEGKSLGESLYGTSNFLLKGMRADYENNHHPLKQQVAALENGIKDAATELADDETLDFDRQKLQERVSLIYTLMRSLGKEHAQSAHFDFPHELLEKFAGQLLLVFFPLTLDGCQLQVWTTGVPDDGDDVVRQHGVLYTIPYGSFLVLPPGSIHGGGFSSNPETGNPRMHVYVVMGDDTDLSHDDFSNEHFSKATNLLLSLRFHNDPSIESHVPPMAETRPLPASKPAAVSKASMKKHRVRSAPPSVSKRGRVQGNDPAITPRERGQVASRIIGSRSSLPLQAAALALVAEPTPISPEPLAAEVIVRLIGQGLEATSPLMAFASSRRQSDATPLEPMAHVTTSHGRSVARES